MLGQEIIIDACVYDYYDQPAFETCTQFMTDSKDEERKISGKNSVLISCRDGLQGINVTGSKISNAKNFTINLTFHVGSQSDTKLSPCHPGFYYDNTTERCLCYDDNDIITCSDSTSFIRRGY